MSPTISRRNLLAVASTGAMGCVGEFLSFIRDSKPKSRETESDLIALCSELGCPQPIGKACLLALPPSERVLSSLSSALRGHNSASGQGCPSPSALAQSISERSRADFQEGRVLSVNGWILALTEVRLYSLAALVPELVQARQHEVPRMGDDAGLTSPTLGSQPSVELRNKRPYPEMRKTVHASTPFSCRK